MISAKNKGNNRSNFLSKSSHRANIQLGRQKTALSWVQSLYQILHFFHTPS